MTDALTAVAEFDRCFTELVDLLCGAARYGLTPHGDARYRACREGAARAYASAAHLLAPHAPADEDPFGALLTHGTLAQALADVRLTDHLYLSRAVLEAWQASGRAA